MNCKEGKIKLAELMEKHDVFYYYRPLKTSILDDIGDDLACSFALMLHTTSKPYLTSLTQQNYRYDLNGNECGDVTEEQKEQARLELKRMSLRNNKNRLERWKESKLRKAA